jgi:hypothetical protein
MVHALVWPDAYQFSRRLARIVHAHQSDDTSVALLWAVERAPSGWLEADGHAVYGPPTRHLIAR